MWAGNCQTTEVCSVPSPPLCQFYFTLLSLVFYFLRKFCSKQSSVLGTGNTAVWDCVLCLPVKRANVLGFNKHCLTPALFFCFCQLWEAGSVQYSCWAQGSGCLMILEKTLSYRGVDIMAIMQRWGYFLSCIQKPAGMVLLRKKNKLIWMRSPVQVMFWGKKEHRAVWPAVIFAQFLRELLKLQVFAEWESVLGCEQGQTNSVTEPWGCRKRLRVACWLTMLAALLHFTEFELKVWKEMTHCAVLPVTTAQQTEKQLLGSLWPTCALCVAGCDPGI